MEYDILIWVAVAVGSLIAVSRLLVIPLLKTVSSVNKKSQKVEEKIGDELNEKNVTRLAGGAAASWIDNMLNKAEEGYQIARDIYQKQQAECVKVGMSPADADKVLKPLKAKMDQAEFFLKNRDALKEVNKALVPHVVGRLARKVIGGIL